MNVAPGHFRRRVDQKRPDNQEPAALHEAFDRRKRAGNFGDPLVRQDATEMRAGDDPQRTLGAR